MRSPFLYLTRPVTSLQMLFRQAYRVPVYADFLRGQQLILGTEVDGRSTMYRYAEG
jgi:hypothetical protein